RKRTPSDYCYRLAYRNPRPDEPGCALLWEVVGGRLEYQIALERQPSGALRWHCTCADAVYRGEDAPHVCKHVRGLLALGPARPRTRAVIQLFLWGGPSQHETFDLKPNAPDGVRGEFRPVATRTPGVRITEHLPRLAALSDRYAVVRSLTHTGVNHGTSAYHMLTGHVHASPGTLRHPSPTDFPSVNCAVNRFGRRPRDLPATVALPSVLHDGDGGEVPGQG